MKLKNVVNKLGFTLLELLMVVLIIGILSAIALPMYKKAVEKSKVSDALTTMSTVAKSEHGWYLVNNRYTKDFSDLDISLTDKDGNNTEGESFESINYTFTLQDSSIKAERKNHEYTLYRLYEDGDIYCLPQEHYICEQYKWGLNQNACSSAIKGFWSNKTNVCYKTEQERCTKTIDPDDENPPKWQNTSGGYCGYLRQDNVNVGENEKCVVVNTNANTGLCQYSTFTGQGSKCEAYTNYGETCGYSTFKDGAICEGNTSRGCRASTFENNSVCNGRSISCQANTYKSNSICYAISGLDTCANSKFYSGSKCYATANVRNACLNSTYYDDSCCVGDYCPANAPKCKCGKDANGRHLTSC